MPYRPLLSPTPHLYSSLGEADLDCQLLPGEHVGVVGPAEGLLQLLQLEGGEGGAVASLLSHLEHSITQG